MTDHLIAPGCEVTDYFCGDSCHCWMGTYCATHQDPSDGPGWPCEAQQEYEETGGSLA